MVDVAALEAEERIGRRVRELRQARGWSQEQLASAMTDLGVTMHQTTVAKVEAAARPIRVNEAAVFAAVLGVRLVDLLETAVVAEDESTREARARYREAQHLVLAAQASLAVASRRHDEAKLEQLRAGLALREAEKAAAAAAKRERAAAEALEKAEAVRPPAEAQIVDIRQDAEKPQGARRRG